MTDPAPEASVMQSEALEHVAKALARRRHRWEGMAEDGRQTYRDDARVALEAIADLETRPSTPSASAGEIIEQCAKIAEGETMPIYDDSDDWCSAYNAGCRDAAVAIRALTQPQAGDTP